MSRVGFLIEPLQFFIELIHPASKGNGYQGYRQTTMQIMASHTVLNCVYNLDHFHVTWPTTSMFLLHIRNLCLLSRQYRLIFLPALLCILPLAPCQITDAIPICTATVITWYGKTKHRCRCDNVTVVLTHDKVTVVLTYDNVTVVLTHDNITVVLTYDKVTVVLTHDKVTVVLTYDNVTVVLTHDNITVVLTYENVTVVLTHDKDIWRCEHCKRNFMHSQYWSRSLN